MKYNRTEFSWTKSETRITMIEFWYRWDFKHRANFTRHIMSTIKYTFWRIFLRHRWNGYQHRRPLSIPDYSNRTSEQHADPIASHYKKRDVNDNNQKSCPTTDYCRVDGTLIDESDRVTQSTLLRLHLLHVLHARSCRAISQYSQRSMRRVRAFDVLNNNVVFIKLNGKIKCTSIERHVRINRGFVHHVFTPP